MNKMNNRLKFRAWLDQEHKMVYQGPNEPLQFFMLKYANNYLMQSTGVYAMNGREIYENDIVREEDHTNPISISPLIDVTWESTAYYNGWSVLAPEKSVKYECLGNLCENPDLIITLYNEANEKIRSLDKELDIALNRIRQLNDPCATVFRDSGTTPLENEQCPACNCFRNSTTCCSCNSETNCCATGYEEEVDFGDSNDGLDAMMADDNGECDKNESCCGNDSEAEEEDLDPDKILEPLEESDRGALILLMRNISNLREENVALKEDKNTVDTQKLQLLKVIKYLKTKNTKLLKKFNNNY